MPYTKESCTCINTQSERASLSHRPGRSNRSKSHASWGNGPEPAPRRSCSASSSRSSCSPTVTRKVGMNRNDRNGPSGPAVPPARSEVSPVPAASAVPAVPAVPPARPATSHRSVSRTVSRANEKTRKPFPRPLAGSGSAWSRDSQRRRAHAWQKPSRRRAIAAMMPSAAAAAS